MRRICTAEFLGWLLALGTIALLGCSTPQKRAAKILSPAVQKTERAVALAEKQHGSIGRLRGSVQQANEAAAKLDRARPDGDTAHLLLALRTTASTVETLSADNDHLRLTLAGVRGDLATATGKVAIEIEKSDSRRWWRNFWCAAFVILSAGIAAVFYFKQTLKTAFPILRFL